MEPDNYREIENRVYGKRQTANVRFGFMFSRKIGTYMRIVLNNCGLRCQRKNYSILPRNLKQRAANLDYVVISAVYP